MNETQQILLQKSADSIDAAQLLAERGYYDFAVSRAYYAMFYVAEAMLLQEELTFSSHAGVIAAFGKEFAKTGRVATVFHRYLIEAQDSRQVSDYNVQAVIYMGMTDAEKQISRAKEFLAMGKAFLEIA
jgi:uncharacterized protein (UPF0332 family)